MQGLVVVGLIVEEISKVDVKCVQVTGAQNKGQGHQVKVSTCRRSTMQGLVVVGLIVEEIWNVKANYVKVTGGRNVGQGH